MCEAQKSDTVSFVPLDSRYIASWDWDRHAAVAVGDSWEYSNEVNRFVTTMGENLIHDISVGGQTTLLCATQHVFFFFCHVAIY